MTRRLAYHNPVYAHDFADPFVLKYCGEYWAYSTGLQPDGRVFGVLRSRDLLHWQEVGGAMAPLPGDYPCYWAPEVTYDNGRFYLYYSVGDEATMHIRLATADHPAGPFTDQGVQLTNEPFAIDAHVFTTSDGRRYFFYATDFLEHERIGTGTVVDRLLDWTTLAGQPRPVSRSLFDWQIYDPRRAEKGDVRWHTIEGPFVLERKGTYYQMFSGGNWQNPTYGVGYATTAELDKPDEWAQACDGERVLPILRTVPDKVIGPGHNSAVRGPDNRQLYCVYHRWSAGQRGGEGDGRQLAIDPLDWAGDRLFVLGPSHTPQVGSPLPILADFFDGPGLGEWRVAGGRWWASDGAVTGAPESGNVAALAYDVGELPFLVEVSARALDGGAGSYGLSLRRDGAPLARLLIAAQGASAALLWADGSAATLPLPPGFHSQAYHLLRVEVDGRRLTVSIDEHAAIGGMLAGTPDSVTLIADGAPAAFAGFALTAGWQTCFDGPAGGFAPLQPGWAIRAGQLTHDAPDASLLYRGPHLTDYDLVVNARLTGQGGSYGIAPALAADGAGPLLTIERSGHSWAVCWQDADATRRFPLPPGFDASEYHQFRLRKENGRLFIWLEQDELGVVAVMPGPTAVGLYARGGVAFDMARVTAASVEYSSSSLSDTSWKAITPSFGPPA